MVLYVMKWNVHPDKKEEYLNWTSGAIKRTLGVPGVSEFRAYRPASGSAEVVVTYEFADMAAWAAWNVHEDTQRVFDELHNGAEHQHGAMESVTGCAPPHPARQVERRQRPLAEHAVRDASRRIRTRAAQPAPRDTPLNRFCSASSQL